MDSQAVIKILFEHLTLRQEDARILGQSSEHPSDMYRRGREHAFAETRRFLATLSRAIGGNVDPGIPEKSETNS